VNIIITVLKSRKLNGGAVMHVSSPKLGSEREIPSEAVGYDGWLKTLLAECVEVQAEIHSDNVTLSQKETWKKKQNTKNV